MNVSLYNLMLFVGAAYALWRGGFPERLVAGSIAAAAMLTRMTLPPVQTRFRGLDPAIVTIDIVLLVILLTIAMRANRIWPLCFCALHLATIYVYVARLINPQMAREAMRILLAYAAYPELLILVVGAARHRRRVTVSGGDDPWS